MTDTPAAHTTSSRVLRTALAILAMAAVALVVLVERQVPRGEEVVATSGDVVGLSRPAYVPASSVRVPGGELTIGIGHPFTLMDWADVSGDYEAGASEDTDRLPPDLLAAPEGGALVPVSWRFVSREGPPADDASLTLRLVSGEQNIALVSRSRHEFAGTGAEAVAVAVSGQPDDVAIEVEFDGVVQRLDAATGEVDAGAAHGLYDSSTFDTFCAKVPSDCSFSTASPDQPLRPTSADYSASPLTTYGYDEELGWPPDGAVWAATYVQTYGGYAYDAAGTSYFIPSRQATQATLRGSGRTVIEASLNELSTQSYGRAVFAVPSDVEPTSLVLRQRATLEDDPRRVPMVARIPLG